MGAESTGAGTVGAIVTLVRTELTLPQQEELGRLVEAGPSGFFPAGSAMYLGTRAVAAVAAALLAVIFIAVRLSRHSFPLEERAFSITSIFVALALCAAAWLGAALGRDLLAGKRSGWYCSSFGFVQVAGKRATVYPWSTLSTGSFTTVRTTTFYDASTGRTSLRDPRPAGTRDSGRSSPIREQSSTGQSREWRVTVKDAAGERQIAIWVADREAFAPFRDEYHARLEAALQGLLPDVLIPEPRSLILDDRLLLALFACGSIVLACLLVAFVISPAMDRALLVREMSAPRAYDAQGIRTERLLRSYADRLSSEQLAFFQEHWRWVCDKDATEARKSLSEAGGAGAKNNLIQTLEKSQELAPSPEVTEELGLLKGEPGEGIGAWREWSVRRLEQALRSALTGSIPEDLAFDYTDVFEEQGIWAHLIAGISSRYGIYAGRDVTGHGDFLMSEDLTEAQLRELLRLLVEAEAWRTVAPPEPAGKTERRASLAVGLGAYRSTQVVPYAGVDPESPLLRIQGYVEGFLRAEKTE